MPRRRGEAGTLPRRARKPSPSQQTASRRPLTLLIGVALVSALVGAALVARSFLVGPASGLDRLAPPPAMSNQPAVVVEHLRARYEAAVRDPASADAVGALCLAYHADMFYEQAELCYGMAASIAPSAWRWVYYRALIRADRGGGEDLVADLRRTVDLQPEYAPAWLRLGDAEFKAGRYDAAQKAWGRAAALPEPGRPDGSPLHHMETPVAAYAAIGLARLRLVQGDREGAAAILEDVAARAPAFGSGFRLLAEAYTAAGRTADAERALARARRLSPFAPYADPVVDDLARESRNSTLLLRLASEADLGVNGPWSEFLTRRALEFDPDNPEVVKKLGRVLSTVGRSEDALPYFRRYREMVPGDFEGLAQLGSCLSDLGRFDEAEPILRRALEGLDDAQTHYNLGLLLARTGRLEPAVESYERALERDPNHANARINLAVVLVRQDRLTRAFEELTRVLRRDPENALAHANLGLVLARQGQTVRAAGAFREALRIDPRLTPAAEALRSLSTP